MIQRSNDGVICGVCAGVAEYFGWNVTAVRILTVLGMIFTGSIIFWLYILAAILLEKKQ